MSLSSPPSTARFRPAALQALAGPRESVPPVPLVRPLDWLALGAIGLLIFSVLGWLLFGTVEKITDGRGIVVRDSEYGIFELAGAFPGRLTGVFFKEGDEVAAGDLVATLHLPDLLEKITAGEKQLTELRAAEPEPSRLQTLESELEDLKSLHKTRSSILSPRAGRVVEVVVSAGNVISTGRTIMRLESSRGDYEVLAYVSGEEGKKIKPGMKVRVVPTTTHSRESGHLKGLVNYVSTYPVTKDYLTSELGGNASLADYLLESGSCIEVDLDLLEDPASGEFLWSPRTKGPVKVESGLLVQAFVIIEEVRPLSLLFPSRK